MHLIVLWPLLLLEIWLPGWVLVRGLLARDEDDEVLLAVPAAALVYGAFALAGVTLRVDPRLVSLAALVVPLGAGLFALALRQRTFWPARAHNRILLLFWIATTSLYLGLAGLMPTFVGGGWFNDWKLSYQLADWYGNYGGIGQHFFKVYTPISRPPLFYMLSGLDLSRWVGVFDTYQITATAWNGTLVFGLWAWLRTLPGRWKWSALLAGMLLPVVAVNLLYPWPKAFTTGLVLTGLYFFRRWERGTEGTGTARRAPTEDGVLAAILFGLGWFAHQLTLAWLAGLAFYLLLRWRTLRAARLRQLAVGGLIVLAVSAPWWLWALAEYGLEPFASATPVFSRVLDRTGYDMVVTRGYNAVGLVLPENTRRVLEHRPLQPESALPPWIEGMQAIWRGTVWGNLGLATLLVLLLALLRWRGRMTGWPGWACLGFIIVFAILVQPLREHGGVAQVVLLPLALVLFAWAARTLARTGSRGLGAAWLLCVVIEFALAAPAWILALQREVARGNIAVREHGVTTLIQAVGATVPEIFLAGGALFLAAWIVLAWLDTRQKEIDLEEEADIFNG